MTAVVLGLRQIEDDVAERKTQYTAHANDAALNLERSGDMVYSVDPMSEVAAGTYSAKHQEVVGTRQTFEQMLAERGPIQTGGITIGHVVVYRRLDDDTTHHVILAPGYIGEEFEIPGRPPRKVMLVSEVCPLGASLIGRNAGDVISMEVQSKTIRATIEQVLDRP